MIWIALIVVLFVVLLFFLGWLEGCSGVVGFNSLKRISVFFACLHCFGGWGSGVVMGSFFYQLYINIREFQLYKTACKLALISEIHSSSTLIVKCRPGSFR